MKTVKRFIRAAAPLLLAALGAFETKAGAEWLVAASDASGVVVSNATFSGWAHNGAALTGSEDLAKDGNLYNCLFTASPQLWGTDRYRVYKTGYHFTYHPSKMSSVFSRQYLKPDNFSSSEIDAPVSYDAVTNMPIISGASTTYQGFYAHAIANEYAVSYALNGGSKGAYAPSEATYDSAFAVSAPTRTGYVFAGWKVCGSNADYATARWGASSGAVSSSVRADTVCSNRSSGVVWFKNLSSTHAGSVALEANWSGLTYSVTTQALGGVLHVAGTGAMDAPLAISWEPVQKPGSVLTFDNVTVYAGTDDQGDVLAMFTTGTNALFTLEGTYHANVHVKLDYRETLLSYSIGVSTADDTKGMAVMSPPAGSYHYGDAIELLATPYDGYAFAEWNDAGTNRYEARRTVSVTKAMTYIASFTNCAYETRTYKIAFDGRGADNAGDPAVMPPQTCTMGVAEVLAPNAFVRAGYTFDGWAKTALRAARHDVDFEDGGTVTDYVSIPDTTGTLFAVWKTNRYLVAFDPMGATEGEVMKEQAFLYDQPQELASNTFARAGYAFGGWYNPETGERYADRAVVSNLCATKDGVCRLEARWKRDCGELSEALGCTNLVWVTHYFSATEPSSPWSVNEDETLGGLVQTNSAHDVLQTEILTNGVLRFDVRALYSEGAGEARLRFYETSNDSTYPASGTKPFEGALDTNIVVSAGDETWHSVTLRITQVGPQGNRLYLNLRSERLLTEVCVRNLRWEPDGEVPEALGTRAITYSNLRGAVNHPDNPDTYAEGTQVTFKDPAGEVTGYAFAGWSPREITKDDRGIKLVVATWNPNAYTVEFAANGGEGDMAPQAFEYDRPQALSKNAFTHPGYAFAGWQIDGGDGAILADGSVVKNLATGGLVLLNAVWKKVETKPCRIVIAGASSEIQSGETVSCATFASETKGLTNVVCAGWVGTGSAPSSGTSNEVSFVVQQDSTLDWLYRTNYWVSVTAASASLQGGSVSLTDAAGRAVTNELWAAAGTNLTAVATPDEGWSFRGWIDAETGVTKALSATYALAVSRPLRLKAAFALEAYPIAYAETKGRANGNPKSYTIEDAFEFEPLAAPAGWTFLGWDPAGIERGTTGPLTVTAQWELSADRHAGTAVVVPPPETTLEGTVTWSAKNLPAGMKIAAKALADKTFGTLEGGTLYGTPTKPGTYVVKITAKSGKQTETFDVSVTIDHYVDENLPLEDAYGVYVVGTKTWLELGEDFAGCKATGLPAGLKFAAQATKDATFGEVSAGTVYGLPTKPCTNCVIFSKAMTDLVDGKYRKVTHTASATFAVAAAPAWAIGTFNGRLDDGSGSVTLTVSAAGKASGKIIAEGKTWTFAAAGYEAPDADDGAAESLALEATAKSGKLTASVACTVASDGATGMFFNDEFSAAFTLWRNDWKDKGATDRLKDYVGVYTVQLGCDDTGYGYLSLTLDAKGNCKATGKLPDGTSASASLPLVWQEDAGDGEGAPMAIWQVSPSAYKGGCVGGLLEWDGEQKVSGDSISWVSLSPTASDEYGVGFSRTMSASGAWYNKLAELAAYYADALTFEAEPPALEATVRTTAYNDSGKKVTTSETAPQEAAVLDCWRALSVSLNEKGTAFAVDQGKATKPVQDKATREWSYAGDNDAALTISFTKATGVFKGTFTCWYDYVSAVDETKVPTKETLTHTSKKVSYEGVMVLDETDNALRGYYLWDRTGSYQDARTLKTKTYKYKESRPVVFQ